MSKAQEIATLKASIDQLEAHLRDAFDEIPLAELRDMNNQFAHVSMRCPASGLLGFLMNEPRWSLPMIIQGVSYTRGRLILERLEREEAEGGGS